MVFSSLPFLYYFLPAALILYFAVPGFLKNGALLLISLAFYGWGEPKYVLLMVFTILSGYFFGLIIEKYRGRQASRLFLLFSVIVHAGILLYFKYADFFIENFNVVTGLSMPLLRLSLPVGISFYTFQSISYLIDIYRCDIEAERSFADFGAYLTMFPQLIAGPIVKYREIRGEIKKRKASWANLDEGLRIFTLGLGMKVLLANRIGSLWSDLQMVGFESISAPAAWMGIFAYSFQLYFDFYGYSLMAIGLGRIMGFTIPVNFDHPYESLSMTEFWRKWHMTLGSWFREYVYIPLGGNRRSSGRVYFNLFAVWLLTGFWHGAGWNFILWGVVLFVIIALEKAGLKKVLDRFRIMGHLYMVILIPLTWMIFAITDIEQLGIYAQRLVDFAGKESDTVFSGDAGKYWDMYGWLLMVCAVLSVSGPARLFERIRRTMAGSIILFAIFWGSVYCLYIGLNDPFLYFRF